jgi:hypothetical protein
MSERPSRRLRLGGGKGGGGGAVGAAGRRQRRPQAIHVFTYPCRLKSVEIISDEAEVNGREEKNFRSAL